MERWQGKVAVVTGASSGIGAAIARDLVHHGMVVVGLARREDRIKQIADEMKSAGKRGKLHAVKTDLRKEEDILAAFSWIERELGGADVLVNNAGVATQMNYLPDCKTEDWRVMLEVNVLAVAISTREYLKCMEKRQNQAGHVFIINSIAGHSSQFGKLGMYSTSKHGIRAFSKCLRHELSEKGSAIKVTTVSPGPVETEMIASGGGDLETLLKSMTILSAEDVSKVVVDTLSASPASQICEAIITPVPTKFGVV